MRCRFFRRAGALLLALVLTLSLVPAAAAAEGDVTGLRIESEKSKISVGDTVNLEISIEYEGDTPPAAAPSLSWSVNPSIGNLSSIGTTTGVEKFSGTFEATAAGTAVITVTCGGQTDTCTITVEKAPTVTNLSVTSSKSTLYVDEAANLTIAIEFGAGATSAPLSWSSTDLQVGTLSTLPASASSTSVTGTFTAQKAGKTTITVSCGEKAATCTITVKDPPAIKDLTISSNKGTTNGPTLLVGEEARLTVGVTFNEGFTSGEMEWSSNKWPRQDLITPPKKVTGTEIVGNFTPSKAGTGNIIVQSGDVSASVEVTVTEPTPVTVTSVAVNPKTLSLTEGGSGQLTATVTMSDNKTNSSVKWSSASTNVATVDPVSGKVTAKAVGTATITATSTKDSTKKDTCTVTVSKAPVIAVTGVTISGGKERTIGLNDTVKLTATVTPENATNKNVTWGSSNSLIATVKEDGTVTGVGEGEATITVTTEDGGKKDTCLVKVQRVIKPVTGITIDPVPPIVVSSRGKTLSLERKDQSVTLAATVYPADAANREVVWTSSDESIVTVDDKGKVTAKEPGVATVTVTSAENDKFSDSCEVTVSGIVISESSVQLKVGQSVSVTATGYGRASGHLIWESADPTIASGGSGKVVGIAVGGTTIRVYAPNTNYEKTFNVTVAENTVRIDDSVNAGNILYFSSLLSRIQAAAREGTGDSSAVLESISSISVATKEGIVHYGYISPDTPNHGVGGSETYYVKPETSRGQRPISDLKYIPAGGFSGTAVISYLGRTTKGGFFNGTIYVDVKGGGDVMLSTAKGRPLDLTAKEFKDICQLKNGRNASYVTFTPPSASKGVLYYNYTPGQYSQKVDGTTKYYLSSNPSLEKVTFVPAENFTGTVSVPYRCTDTTGGSYSGTMTINVYASEGAGSGGVEYTTGIGQRVTLNASDFNSACMEANDRTLSYIYFEELPPASQGILYYNYTSSSSNRVDTATRYNRSGTGSRISNITFVPASNFSGDVTVPYTGYDAAGQTYKDNLVIHVSDAAGTVYYSTDVGGLVTFRAEDFNEACQRANNSSLNYVTFTPPSSSVGTLYRNYRSSSNTGSKVSASTRFYRGGTPSVSDITFVPKSRYEGTVSIPFTGRDAAGEEFEGTVSISVGTGAGRVVKYSTASGGMVRFSASDFNAVCRSATGDDLNYLSFELPASRYGTLYYQYNTARGSGTLVSTTNSYYRSGSGRLLDDVYFVSANVNGVASFQYTARSTGGERFTGTVEVAIGNAGLDSGVSSGTRYIGSSTPITLHTQDFEAACQSAVGGTLSHIRFTSLPSEDVGRLYMNYESPSRPGGVATTTSNYTASSGLTIGQLSFVAKAGYQGQVYIPYTGYSTQGGTFSGSVTIDISTGYCATPFYDVASGWDWAKPSVEFLRYAGVSNGYSNGSFRPSRSISRGEFTLMVCRAFGFDTSAKVSSFPDVPASSPYAGAVATARSMGIVEGSGGRFRPDSPITRQSAMTIICRAMKAAGEKLPVTGSSVLNGYSDQARIASHARESVAALVSLGVVKGSSDMRINPTRSISRAEMAVILHRVLTL